MNGEVAPLLAVVVPGGHEQHVDDPGVDAYVPSGQAVHVELDPAGFKYVPTGQLAHEAPDVESAKKKKHIKPDR